MNNELIKRIDEYCTRRPQPLTGVSLVKDCKVEIELLQAELAKAREYVPMTYSERMNWLKDSGYEANTAILLEYEKEIIQRANLTVKESDNEQR